MLKAFHLRYVCFAGQQIKFNRSWFKPAEAKQMENEITQLELLKFF